MGKSKIGMRIRHMRIKQSRTIQELADACGLSKSMVSKIETSSVIPSVATLYKLAGALGVNISILLDENEELSAVYIPAAKVAKNLTLTEKGYSIFPFASEFKDKKMQPFLFEAKKGKVKPHSVSHLGEEFIYVIKGEMKFEVGDKVYSLKVGDSLYFNSLEKHHVVPVAASTVYLDIFI